MCEPYIEPECYWCRQCTSGRCVFHADVYGSGLPNSATVVNSLPTTLAEINAKLDRIAAQRTYEQLEMVLIEAQNAVDLLESAPFEATRECAEAFGQWYDQWRIGYDAESANKVYSWLTAAERYQSAKGQSREDKS